ncbi:Calcium-dependent protein kinase 22 (OsCDPK22) (OsCPK22) [Durusdinium trenchii]|uniref:Calcium-dependent protein kinase 22 (OsCDPK22) (OsCPK22) n=1 Tax=Durusdinium trenchii TaxID=1381693 RepID=A0ABP0NB98_9DINO
MGILQSTNTLDEVRSRAEDRVGHLSVVGRYHRLPARLEDDYNVEKKALGTGYNGSVLLARGKTRVGKFAVKAFKLHGVSKEKKQELASEAEIFLSMDHPHVVRLFDVYEEEDRLSLVMECMEGGELFDRVREKKVYSEKDACKTTRMMLLAVNYLHSCGVVHRDLKLENFLYENKNSDFLKLIDFGFSKVWAKNTRMELSCGTLSYAAPEVLAKSYTSQCDLWSLGVIVFILLVGYMPFAGSDERKQIHMIRSGTYLVKKERWAKVSSLASDFVKNLLVVDPDRRMTAPEALEHPWIKNQNLASDCIDEAMVTSLCDFAKAQSFRRSCMKLMAWSLTAPERAQVRDAFMALDKDNTGTITMKDLKTLLEDNFHLPEEDQQHVFNAFSDSEHPMDDNEIQYSEFLAAMMASRIALHDELLKDAFRRFDTESTGYIRREDLFKILESETEVAQVMRELDVNGDGKISYEEFIGYLKDGNAADDTLEAAERAISREIICRHREDGSEPRLRKRDKLKGIFHRMFSS